MGRPGRRTGGLSDPIKEAHEIDGSVVILRAIVRIGLTVLVAGWVECLRTHHQARNDVIRKAGPAWFLPAGDQPERDRRAIQPGEMAEWRRGCRELKLNPAPSSKSFL